MGRENSSLNDLEKYFGPLIRSIETYSDGAIALGQAAYMRDQFAFYGVKTKERRAIAREFFDAHGYPEARESASIVKFLWTKPQRECQYIAQEMALRVMRKPLQGDLQLFEYMVTEKSWWDTVDFIAAHILGRYFKCHPDTIFPTAQRWLDSGNIWLQRSALLFQLKYKADLDTALLSACIMPLLGSKEFFINKAIGWILREYSKTNPGWVEHFCDITPLSNLSQKEAMRIVRQK